MLSYLILFHILTCFPVVKDHAECNLRRNIAECFLPLAKAFLGVIADTGWKRAYRYISNIGRTKSQNLNVSRLVLQLSFLNLLKPDVKSRMKM